MNVSAESLVDRLLEREASAQGTAEPSADFSGPRIAPARQGSSSEPDFYPDVEDVRQLNWEALQRRTSSSIVQLVYASFPTNTKFIRVHESESRPYEPAYYEAWAFIARDNPDVLTSVFTFQPKSWASHLGSLPKNLELIDQQAEPEQAEPEPAPTPKADLVKEGEETPDEQTLLVYADEDDENTFDVFV